MDREAIAKAMRSDPGCIPMKMKRTMYKFAITAGDVQLLRDTVAFFQNTEVPRGVLTAAVAAKHLKSTTQLEIINLLFEAGARATEVRTAEVTGLLTQEHISIDLVVALVVRGASIGSIVGGDGPVVIEPLAIAIILGNCDAITALATADNVNNVVSATALDRLTELASSSVTGNTSATAAVETILKSTEDWAPWRNGAPMLVLAVLYASENAITTLLAKGADPWQTNNNGDTALQIAAATGWSMFAWQSVAHIGIEIHQLNGDWCAVPNIIPQSWITGPLARSPPAVNLQAAAVKAFATADGEWPTSTESFDLFIELDEETPPEPQGTHVAGRKIAQARRTRASPEPQALTGMVQVNMLRRGIFNRILEEGKPLSFSLLWK